VSTEQWIASGSVAAVIVAAIAIVVSMILVRDQLRTIVFLEYTKRFNKIMRRLPVNARKPGSPYRLAALPEGDRMEVVAVFRDYFNMCSEEMWLKSAGRIDSGTWNIWCDGMKDAARTPAFPEAWSELADEYRYHPKFRNFMDVLIRAVAKEQTPLQPGASSGTSGPSNPAA
jgi:hypothetical protein